MGVELEHFHGFVASVFALVRSFRMIRVFECLIMSLATSRGGIEIMQLRH